MRRKIKILIGALLLCITAASARIPMSYAEAESASASDFQMKGDLLVKYTGTASAVSIPTSVKQIGKEAFAGHTELRKVVIPAYVESIEYNAFSGCTSLETIKIPDTVTEIGNGAFSGCTSLKSVSLGKKVEKLGIGVFADCHALETVTLSRKNEDFAYDSGVIYSNDKKIVYCMLPGYKETTYKMPSSVEEIRNNAFWGCKKLKRVEMGSNVKVIPDYAFTNCTSLETVLLPYSLHSIGMQAFANCLSLGEVSVPVSVAQMHETAFDGCPKLKIVAEEGSYAADYEEKRDKSNVAQMEYQDIIGNASEETDDATDGDTANSGQNGGTSANLIGQSAIVGGNAVVFIDNSQSKVLSGNITVDLGDGTAKAEVMETESGFPKYTIVNNEKIASQAFYGNKELTEYKMPEKIQSIGDFAFARSGLTKIEIPEGVTSIGYGAFYHCDDLAEVQIPSTVTSIEPAAFAETAWIEEILKNRREPYAIVGDGILIAYSGMTSKVEIPEGVKQIGAEVFKDNKRITSVRLPESLTVIGEDAFAGCSNLVSVSMGSNVQEICDRAFEGCPISTIKIPASVQQIGLKAFDISAAKKENGTKVAVFLGTTLPKLSYEKTATRLSNEVYRDAVFKDVEIAIVDKSITASDIEGSVLGSKLGGFQGLICSVEQTASGDTPGLLQVKYYVMPASEITSETIPEQVTVYGKTYEVQAGEEEPGVIWEVAQTKPEGIVEVELISETIPSVPEVTAAIDGAEKDYVLRITDNTTAGSDMTIAYRKVSSGDSMRALQVYNIALYEAERRIPISRLGNQQMTITMPKPRGILKENLKVVCMDEDGQLEKVESRLVTVDGVTCVQFEASHFSTYGIYN